MNRTDNNTKIQIQRITGVSSQLLRLDSVENLTGIGRAVIYGLIKEKKFPSPVTPEGLKRVSAWVYGDIKAWLDRQAQQSPDFVAREAAKAAVTK